MSPARKRKQAAPIATASAVPAAAQPELATAADAPTLVNEPAAATLDAVASEPAIAAAPASEAAPPSAEPEPTPAERLAKLLSPAHLKLISDSAISPEVALARGYRTITKKVDLESRGFAKFQRNVPALLVPIFNAAGELATYQIRPDTPRARKGGITKYETPEKSKLVIDVPLAARQWVRDPSRPLFITEGARKADAAVSKGICCIALPGVWGWRGRNEHEGHTTLPDWDQIALKGANGPRLVYIVFDSDVTTKASVQKALERLKGFLDQRGAQVVVLQLPPDDAGGKVGLDDFLAAGKTLEQLLATARTSSAPVVAVERPDDAEYYSNDEGTFWRKWDEHGDETIVRLANFSAKIVGDVARDDGAEVQRNFELECELKKSAKRVLIPTGSLEPMSWVLSELGARAVVEPGLWVHGRFRAAIQALSDDITPRTVYTHTGWRDIGGQWVYLHAGGAIGANGAQAQVEVDLKGVLAGYVLPAPPAQAQRIEAFRAWLRLRELGPLELMWPVIACIARTAVGNSKVALHLSGPTGVFKTEVAALAQQFWGAGMDSKHLPGSWSSTANATEAISFFAKDAVLVVDDFAPRGSAHDQQRFHQQADRIFRAQANGSSRLRLRPDGSFQAHRPPRCSLISTGEENPSGQSIRARVVILEVASGDIDAVKLSACQREAAAGVYAEALSSFIEWLAPRLNAIRRSVAQRVLELREECAQEGQHRRTPGLIAELQTGAEVLLQCMREVGAIDAEQVGPLLRECYDALLRAGASQRDHVQSSEPTEVFFRLLRSGLTSGAAHMRSMDGEAPPEDLALALGWVKSNGLTQGLIPNGAMVGWIDGPNAYLEVGAAMKVAAVMASDGDRLAVSIRTLCARLRDRGALLSRDDTKDRNLVRITVAGARHAVAHVRASLLLGGPQSPHSLLGSSDGVEERVLGDEAWGATVRPAEASSPPSSPQPFAGGVGNAAREGIGAEGAKGDEAEQETRNGGSGAGARSEELPDDVGEL